MKRITYTLSLLIVLAMILSACATAEAVTYTAKLSFLAGQAHDMTVSVTENFATVNYTTYEGNKSEAKFWYSDGAVKAEQNGTETACEESNTTPNRWVCQLDIPFEVNVQVADSVTCWGDFTVTLYSATEVHEDYCIEDGYTATFAMTDGGQINVTVTEDFAGLKEVTRGGENRTTVKCHEDSAQTWSCGDFTLSVEGVYPREVVVSGANELYGILYPAEIPADLELPHFDVENVIGFREGTLVSQSDAAWSLKWTYLPMSDGLQLEWSKDGSSMYIVNLHDDVCYNDTAIKSEQNADGSWNMWTERCNSGRGPGG